MSMDDIQLRQPEPPVSKNVATLWSDDVLNRKEFAEKLAKLIKGQKGPLVISLDGEWGTGKTYFLKRWKEQLQSGEVSENPDEESKEESQKFDVVYYNAWEDDFHSDPIVTIIGQLPDLGDGKLGEIRKIVSDIDEKSILDTSKGAIKGVAKIVLEIIKSRAPSLLTAVGVPIDIEGIMKDLKGDAVVEYNSKRKLIDDMKEKLTEWASQMERPLVFIVDELDRCRPTFAIELLERIKHIFDIPNMIFVLGINRKELRKSIQSVYGNIDAEVYLRRFIDLEYMIREPDLDIFCEHRISQYGIVIDQYSGLEMLPYWCRRMGLSLRDVDFCVRSMVSILRILNDGGYSDYFIVCLLVILRVKNKYLYRRYVNEQCNGADVVNYIIRLIPEKESGAKGEDKWKLTKELNKAEACLYAYDRNSTGAICSALSDAREDGNSESEILSNRIGELLKADSGIESIEFIEGMVGAFDKPPFFGGKEIIRDIFGLIEL